MKTTRSITRHVTDESRNVDVNVVEFQRERVAVCDQLEMIHVRTRKFAELVDGAARYDDRASAVEQQTNFVAGSAVRDRGTPGPFAWGGIEAFRRQERVDLGIALSTHGIGST
jgi:hypothetical protein